MSQTLEQQFKHTKQQVDAFLEQQLLQRSHLSARLQAAMRHGLLLGGKRVRPFLVVATAGLKQLPIQQVLPVAAAIECIHAYSLIHDDLPAMDDDELRRGQPTCHIAFDEATAILAGDALQTMAFELLSTSESPFTAEQQLAFVRELAQASGAQGMCGGQALDLAATDQRISLEELEQVHRAKTGALLCASVQLGAIAAELPQNDRQTLAQFAAALGLAFQVQDDILDLTSDTQTLGKPQGSDLQANKSTYPALLGLAGAQAKAATLHSQALQALQALPYNTELLEAFTQYLLNRTH